ncbi:MAG: AAA family ATPase [Deltaproteobacteria bacterium]|nr:AAA family ATPase [Deltaproteobacteria bacterium]
MSNDNHHSEGPDGKAPLAARMRPRTLDEFVGQAHIAAPGRLLRRAIQADQLSSIIFHGPPGTGKTTLAMVIANTTRSRFISLNAVLAGVKDLREAIAAARKHRDENNRRTILFVDEIHRWNKAQQDALLPWVENGTVILIGATTENPYFSVNPPLVSRSRIFRLEPLNKENLRAIALQALADPERGYGALTVRLEPDALEHLAHVANGDARSVLNALELAVETTPPDDEGAIVVGMAVAEESIQQRAVLYDRDGDAHYDTISAFIKSLRGSDPDAALYWLAKMVYAGEDPRFMFRRMLILAGEDVGLADPEALRVVTACADAFDRVGLPEGRFHLAEAALYLATAPKSNSTLAFFDALRAVEEEGRAEVPSHLKDPSRDKKGFGHGEGYLYPHAYRDHWTPQQYLPDTLQGKVFYHPSDQGHEKNIRVEMAQRREAQLAAMVEGFQAAPEALTFSPDDRNRDRWLQRAVNHGGIQLAGIRDRILAAAKINRHGNVLDLNAGTGLLTWEAVRRTPEGSVWALVSDEKTASGLHIQASNLKEVDRPVIMNGALDNIRDLISEKKQGHVRFDAMVGRNALLPIHDKAAAVRVAAQVLAPEGIISLVEGVPRRGQRIYDLVDHKRLDKRLVEKWISAEEAIYEDTDDPMVNWPPDDLAHAFDDAGLLIKHFQSERTAVEILVTEGVLSRWFPETIGKAKGAKASYRERLASFLSPDEVDQIRLHITEKLAGKQVQWTSESIYLVAHLRRQAAVLSFRF